VTGDDDAEVERLAASPAARAEVRRVLLDEGGYEVGLRSVDDPDLVGQ